MNYKTPLVSTFLPIIFFGFVITCALIPSYSSGQGESVAVRQKIESLEKQLLELQEGTALLMENLANCAEENEILRSRLEKKEKGNSDEDISKKNEIIRSIRDCLKTEADLSFLLGLDREHLTALLAVIKEKAQEDVR